MKKGKKEKPIIVWNPDYQKYDKIYIKEGK